MVTRSFAAILAAILLFLSFPVHAQVSYVNPMEQSGRIICPGSFPTDLTVTNCEFTQKLRVQQWIAASVSDEAMLGAVVYGAGAQIIKSPGEWGRNWGGYGDRIGVRYSQAAARGTAEFIAGNIMHDDPRHLSYKDDPHTHYGEKLVGPCISESPIKVQQYPVPPHLIFRRIGHAFFDSVTVIKSNPCGNGHRLPAIDRLFGVAASAYGGYPIYPAAENTLPNAADRAAMAYGSTLLGSFYTEFSPEISLGLGKLFGQKKK